MIQTLDNDTIVLPIKERQGTLADAHRYFQAENPGKVTPASFLNVVMLDTRTNMVLAICPITKPFTAFLFYTSSAYRNAFMYEVPPRYRKVTLRTRNSKVNYRTVDYFQLLADKFNNK